MISQKFSAISEQRIISFITDSEKQADENLLDSIESISDLWSLAKMKETYNEENIIHSSVTSINPYMCSSD